MKPHWAVALVAIAVSWLIGVAWMAPPTVLPLDAPSDRFSGARAITALTHVLGDERPHPVGTLGNRMVEARIQEALSAHAMRARVEQDTICAEHCARVRNLLVELPGTDPGLAPVLVSTHYDSVNSGPGAGDAGAAVGTLLELTRLLRAHPLKRPVHLLFNEGEEAGLLGAQVYLRQPRDVAAVINLEARGTGGNAFLFELKGAALPWVRRYATQATAPSISSLYTTIYALLPNNTDATIYGDHGLPVANVAFLGGGVRYHVLHASVAATVELVRQAKAAGLAVTMEVTPQHLVRSSAAFGITMAMLALAPGMGVALVVSVLLGLASIRATSPQPGLRDGALALALATTACQRTKSSYGRSALSARVTKSR